MKNTKQTQLRYNNINIILYITKVIILIINKNFYVKFDII